MHDKLTLHVQAPYVTKDSFAEHYLAHCLTVRYVVRFAAALVSMLGDSWGKQGKGRFIPLTQLRPSTNLIHISMTFGIGNPYVT